MKSRSLCWLVCSILLTACFVEPLDEEETEVSAQALAAEVGLPADHQCGNKAVKFRPNKKAPKRNVFHMPDKNTWHKNNPCLDDLLAAAKTQPSTAPIWDLLYHQTLYVLSNPNVRLYEKGSGYKKLDRVTNADGELQLSKFDRVVYLNDRGIAYDSMSAVDFGQWLLSAALATLKYGHPHEHYRKAFKQLGLATLEVITDPVSENGLRSRSKCEKKPKLHCSWFHSVTNRNHAETTAGNTLNKGLHPVRDLYRSAQTLKSIDQKEPDPALAKKIVEFEEASKEGAYQLVYGGPSKNGSPPNFFDFFAKKNGKPIVRSWLYYGFNAEEDRAYFLKGNGDGPWKNCNYHMHVMELLANTLPKLDPIANLEGYREKHASLGNRSILEFIVATYQEKLDDGLKTDSKTVEPGFFGGCADRKLKFPADQELLAF